MAVVKCVEVGADKVTIAWPPWRWPGLGEPRNEQAVVPVLRNTTAPAKDDEVPPNCVKSTDAETDDDGQGATFRGVLAGEFVWVADDAGGGETVAAAKTESAPKDAAAMNACSFMPASQPKAEGSDRVLWPDGERRRGWPGRAGGGVRKAGFAFRSIMARTSVALASGG